MQKKDLEKVFKEIFKDVMDNFDVYTDKEKEDIKKLLKQMYILNQRLDKYDKPKKKKEFDFYWD